MHDMSMTDVVHGCPANFACAMAVVHNLNMTAVDFVPPAANPPPPGVREARGKEGGRRPLGISGLRFADRASLRGTRTGRLRKLERFSEKLWRQCGSAWPPTTM